MVTLNQTIYHILIEIINNYLIYQNGQSTISIGKRRKKRQSEEVCNLMPNRCSSCRGGTGGTAEAEQTEFNEFCKIIKCFLFQNGVDII